jgi:hypothetical protein
MVLIQIYNFFERRIDFIKHKEPFDNCPKGVRLGKCSLMQWLDVKAGDAVLPDDDFVVSENPETEICEFCRKCHSKTR